MVARAGSLASLNEGALTQFGVDTYSISKALGGSELMSILRTLGDFLRQDLALRREIEVKHGWIKNSRRINFLLCES